MIETTNIKSRGERGISVFMVAVGLIVFMGFLALVIDLGMLYGARSDAQKAAEAASLAGAKYFIDEGTLPTSLNQNHRDGSKAMAKAIGSENAIRGAKVQPAEVIVNDADIVLLPTSNGPIFQVSATVQRQNLSTFFGPILGITGVDVSAAATAHSSKAVGSGGGAPPSFNVGSKCIKPWILQNLNPLNQAFGPSDLGTMVLLHDDQSTNGPSKWGIIAPCPTYTPPPAIPCDGGNSSTVYEENIINCNPNTYYCSAGVTVHDVPGNKVGKTQSGVRTLIHQGGGNQSEGTNNGQDTIQLFGTGPNFRYEITGGSNNPNPALRGKLITDSDSIVIVPLTNDPPPTNGQLQTNIVGFLKLFLTQVHPPNAQPKSAKNQIDAIIIGFNPCSPSAPGGGGNGLPNVSSTSGGIDILRLVR